MAEILIHRYGRGDPLDDADWQPVDAVVVKEDGQQWGSRELGDGTSFFLIRLPGVAKSSVDALTEGEVDAELKMTKRRKRTFNYAQMPDSIKAIVTINPDGTVDLAGNEITLTGQDQADFLSAIKLK